MKGLLTKEKYVMWQNCGALIIVPVFFLLALLLSFVTHHLNTLSGYPVGLVFMLMGIIPINTANLDVQSKWNHNCLTMPYSRDQIVCAKYICSLILTAGTFAVFLPILLTFMLLSDGALNLTEILRMLFSGFAVGLLPAIAFLPFSFKWYDMAGGKKVILGGLIGGLCGSINILLADSTPGMKGSLIMLAVAVAAFAVSWLISIAIFRKKDI